MAQYAKTAAVKRGIVDACLTAFGEAGFHGVSMAELARRAEVSYTGLLHHFPRKEDLLTAVLELQDERTAEFLRIHSVNPGSGTSSSVVDADSAPAPDSTAPESNTSVTSDADQDPLVLLHGIAASLSHRGQQVGLLELNAVLSGEATSAAHPAHEYFQQRYRNIRSFMTRLFVRLKAEGRLRSQLPPEHLAASLIALVDGLQKQWLFEPGSVDVDRAVREHLELLVITPEN